MNIIEPIFAQCKNKPSELALCAPGTLFNLVSYARLERIVNNICRRIISTGIVARSRVAVAIDDPIFHAMILIGLGRLGIITISGCDKKAPWPIRIDGVIADGLDRTLTSNCVLADPSWAEGDGQAVAQSHVYRALPDEICSIFLIFETGGRGRAISMTNRMIATRIERQKLFLGRRAPFCDRTYLDAPLATPLGFQVLLATLWRGGVLVMTGDTEKTIGILPTYKIENVIGSAETLLKLADMIECRPGYGSSVKAVFSAGTIASLAAYDRVRARLCSNLTTGYMAEDATMVSSMPLNFTSVIPGSAGYTLPGTVVEIVDDDARVVRPEKEGILRIRSDHGATEYLEDQGETQRAFRNGWFYPGDRGQLRSDNMLVISSQVRSVQP